MQALSFSMPGLLLPAITMLMLAYTQRFLGVAAVTRRLITQYRQQPDVALWTQLQNLKLRLSLLRHVQALAAVSLTLCVACFCMLFLGYDLWAQKLFVAALLSMLASLLVSLGEIHLSLKALNAAMSTARIRN